MFEFIKEILTQINRNPYADMARLENVRASVPVDSNYVTIGEAIILTHPPEMDKPGYDPTGQSQSVTGEADTPSTPVYTVHNGSKLMLISQEGQLFETPLESIERIRTMGSISTIRFLRRGGFYFQLKDGQAILLSTQIPVQKDPTSTYRTIGFSSDTTGGWADELKPLGIETDYTYSSSTNTSSL